MENFNLTWYVIGFLTPVVALVIYGLVLHVFSVISEKRSLRRMEAILEAQGDAETLAAFREAGTQDALESAVKENAKRKAAARDRAGMPRDA